MKVDVRLNDKKEGILKLMIEQNGTLLEKVTKLRTYEIYTPKQGKEWGTLKFIVTSLTCSYNW